MLRADAETATYMFTYALFAPQCFTLYGCVAETDRLACFSHLFLQQYVAYASIEHVHRLDVDAPYKAYVWSVAILSTAVASVWAWQSLQKARTRSDLHV